MQGGDARDRTDFSLVLGGPIYQLLLRGRLLRPPIDLVHRRIIACVAVTWLPLAVLSLLAGSFTGSAGVSFLADLDVHVRFLAWLPLMIAAETVVHFRLRAAVEQFTERQLVSDAERPRFEGIIASAMRLRNSVAIELILLALAVTVGHWLWRSHAVLSGTTWYSVAAEGSVRFTWAGYWYTIVSLSIGRFFIARWVFRLAIWYAFLWRVSRLKLLVDPLHPDHAGGLGFLVNTIGAFAPLLFAQSVLLAGVIANRIFHAGARLPDFKFEIIAFEVFLSVLALLPLTFFCLRLAEAKRAGIREYGRLASRYARKFWQKWLGGAAAPEEPLLGHPDIQSLADLANSYEVVQKMRLLPFGRQHVLRLVILMSLPLLPLLLTLFPLEEMIRRLFKLLL